MSRRWHPHLALLLSVPLSMGLACAGSGERDSTFDESPQAQSEEAGADTLAAALERAWADAGVEPSPLADDAEFIRRASLDLIGRVPTQGEVERFLASDRADKRAALLDALLASEAFAEHWAALWTDELLTKDKKGRRLAGEALEGYFAEALTDNRPWSQVLRELLEGEGELRDQPELAYIASRNLRGQNKSEAVAELSSTTARVFLGSRIECAQCHDHPYVSEFTREDFWAQAAFFGRTRLEIDKDKDKPDSELMGDPAMAAGAKQKAKEKKKKNLEVRVGERRKGELRVALGGDEDPRKQAITPRFLGAADTRLDEQRPRRKQLAELIIADDRFAEATVGWVWTRLLGSGIVEPWDELLSPRERPELLSILASDFRASDHDLRALIREIALSPAYQRSSAGPQQSERDIARAEASFARARVRPLSAEQLFASLLTVTALEQVGGRNFRRAVRAKKEAALREYEFVFNDDEMAAADGFAGNVPQALLMLNGGLTNQGVVAREGSSLDRILSEEASVDARLEDLWLTVYGRPPRAEELDFGREAVGSQRREDWEDLMFAMIYSSEFSSNH